NSRLRHFSKARHHGAVFNFSNQRRFGKLTSSTQGLNWLNFTESAPPQLFKIPSPTPLVRFSFLRSKQRHGAVVRPRGKMGKTTLLQLGLSLLFAFQYHRRPDPTS